METFQRFEKKYLLDKDQYDQLMEKLKDHIVPDKFFKAQINSIYYDTDDHQMIRRSIEKPEYKEKLRVRSYEDADKDDRVFVELKKKLDGIVYKRRAQAKCDDVLSDIDHCKFDDEQVSKEIGYVLNCYHGLKPSIYIGCSRNSFVDKDDEDLRITFDSDLRYRMNDLSLRKSDKDRKLTDQIVMELKVKQAMPIWLCRILDEVKAYPQSYSKAGDAYLMQAKGV